MTFDAQQSRIEFGWNRARRVVHMLSQGPVAGLAGHADMLPSPFFLENVTVTGFARAMTCEGHRLGGDLGNRISAIMSILAKAAGNKHCAQNREHRNPSQEHRCYSEKMFGIFETLHSGTGIWPAWMLLVRRYFINERQNK
ncbi:MAG: hypothetical protein WB987_09210 [Candidatus Acidiferrales bacterium]